MNGFLVLLVHTCDDIPLYLTANKNDATAFAMRAPWEAPAGRLGSHPVHIRIVPFKDGKPLIGWNVRTFESEAVPCGK